VNFSFEDGLIFVLSVDGTHCPINEPRPFDTKWSSHKLGKAAGIDYELGIRIHDSKVAWIHSAPAGKNDIDIFRMRLKDALPVGKRCVGDLGYQGEPEYISYKNALDPRELQDFKDRVMSRHESFNSRVKNFCCLKTKFRHGVSMHKACFEAICVIQQLEMNNGSQEPLMDAYPKEI
jgi:hypothetical protein